MKNFTYYRPKTTEEAVGLLEDKWGGAELLAGGTDLLDLQKEYIAQPDKVVSLNGITGAPRSGSGSSSVSDADATGFTAIVPPKPKDPRGSSSPIVIGAGVKLADIAEHADLKKRFPALATAAGDVGGPQIRNMATLGGNLCQRNRCWYFRDEHVNCLLKGGKKCFAIDGENRYHAIFTEGQPCVIVHPSTLAPVLIALGATVQVAGKETRSL